MAMQADGKIVAAGIHVRRLEPRSSRWCGTTRTARWTRPSAAPGKVTTPIGSDDSAYSVALQPDGKIVVAGYSSRRRERPVFAVVRYEGGPTCGNGTSEFPEDCDDGNTLDGDCRSSTCQYECDDGDACNL